MTLYRVLKYVAFILGGVGLALYLWLLTQGDEAIKASPDLQENILSPFLILTWIVIGIAIISVLVFVIANLIEGNIKRILISVGAFAVVFLIAFISGDSTAYELPNGTYVPGQLSKWVDTGLYMFYILAVVAILAMLISSVKKLTFRN
ncbi:MAG TPA: hypothetical protein VK021_10820 [Flavobacteriaceae bacterium]|nr:hypothetical protein [Flavobacteriaceae bacterium]